MLTAADIFLEIEEDQILLQRICRRLALNRVAATSYMSPLLGAERT